MSVPSGNGAEAEAPVDLLLVDDREDGLLALEAVLGPEGYRLTRSSSGIEAIARLYERDFAVILLDVQMPEMNGFETARIIRSHESSRNVPILFITAINKDASHIYQGYESGAADYLFKPFDPHVLKSKVRIFAELYRRDLKIREQAGLLLQAERRRNAELSGLNRQIAVAMEERMKAQKEILRISEREQKRIGQDLHDGIAQELAAVSFLCCSLWRRLEERLPEEAALALQILDLSKKAVQGTKGMARIFYPVELESLGLLGALEELAAATARVFEVDCRLRCDEPLPLEDEEVCAHLYRIVQEAVHNAARHAGAKSIRIEIKIQDAEGVLSVTDDGIGLPEDTRSSGGMGLRIMDYRAKTIGGRLTVEAAPSGGTSVLCRFPLPSPILTLDAPVSS